MEENNTPAAEPVGNNIDALPPDADSAKPVVDADGKEKVESAATEGPITEADRTKYGIPAKFTNWEAVVKWGSEAEKAKSNAESEKDKAERKMQEYEEMLLELQNVKDSAGLTTDEKSQINAKFQEDFSTNPTETIQKILNEFEKRIISKQIQSNQVLKWEKEEAEMLSDPIYKDIWLSEVKPALIKIAKERPYLNSLEELMAIYERNKSKESKFNKDDSDAKRTAKAAALSESGHSSGGLNEDLMKKIAAAKNNEELEKLAARIK